MARKNALFMKLDEHTTEETNETRYNVTKADSHKSYRTRQKARNTAEIPCRLPIITNSKYLNALTLNQDDNAYLQPLSDISELKYENGVLLFKGLPATSGELNILWTGENTEKIENIEKLNLPLLRALYAIFLTKFFGDLTNEQNTNEIITIYYPEFAKKLGKSPSISQTDVTECIKNIKLFQIVVGIINKGTKSSDILPVLIFMGNDKTKNTISFSSPYMARISRNIYEASIRKDKKGATLLKKNGEPQMFPSYSYLINMDIAKEKNKKAVEIVFIVVTLIERAGDNKPHIRAKTIVERNPLLHKSLDGQSPSNKNLLLKRAFLKAWELLKNKTALTKVYKNIQLPDPEDISLIPTSSTLDMPFDFPHDGKNKDV